MTMSRRVNIGFMIIIVCMMFFGGFVQYAFFQLNAMSIERQRLNEMQAIVVQVKSDTLSYQSMGERTYIYTIYDSIERLSGIYSASNFATLSVELDEKINQIVGQVTEFKEVLNNYMVLSDQMFALETQMTKATDGITHLIQTNYSVADSAEIKYYFDAVDTLMKIKDLSDLRSGSEAEAVAYFENIKALETIADNLMAIDTSLKGQLFSSRIANLVQQQEEFYQKTLKHREEEESFQSILSQLTTNLDRVVDLALINEKELFQEKNNALIFLSVFLIFAFVGVAGYTSIAIAKKLKSSLDILVKATELISVGEFKEVISIQGDKDIESLSLGINEMANKLEMSRRELEAYNTSLEFMVEDKTKELNAANHELEVINENLIIEKERLAFAAMTDYLTQLKNRGYLIEFLRQRIQEAKRYVKSFSVMLLDIDKFKDVNDRFGHQMGDEVLKTIANILLEEIRVSDVAGRYGGEEFLVIFTDTPLREALFVAERIRLSVDTHTFNEEDLHVMISGGLLEYKGESEDDLIKKVDALLYEAKAAGRNCIVTENNTV